MNEAAQLLAELRSCGFDIVKCESGYKVVRLGSNAAKAPPELMAKLESWKAEVRLVVDREVIEEGDERCGTCRAVMTAECRSWDVLCSRSGCPHRSGSPLEGLIYLGGESREWAFTPKGDDQTCRKWLMEQLPSAVRQAGQRKIDRARGVSNLFDADFDFGDNL